MSKTQSLVTIMKPAGRFRALATAAALFTIATLGCEGPTDATLKESTAATKPVLALKCVNKQHNGLYFSKYLGGAPTDAVRNVELIYGRGKCQRDDRDGSKTLDAFTVSSVGYVDEHSADDFVPSQASQHHFQIETQTGKIFAVAGDKKTTIGTVYDTKPWSAIALSGIKKLRLLVVSKGTSGQSESHVYSSVGDRTTKFDQRFIHLGL